MTTPLFSILVPVYEPPLDVLEETIRSVLAQDFDDWELVLVDDCSPTQGVRDLLARFAASDERIRLIERETNGHIVAASNDAVAAARGEFMVLFDHDDLLTPDALSRNAEEITRHDDIDYLYSDEDKVDDTGRLYDRFRKPDWSPERLRGQMYTSHLSVIRASIVREVEGFRTGYEGSQDHDLVLRVTERARRVVHINEVLYHWRVVPGSAAGDVDAKPYAAVAGCQAVQDHLDRSGIDARATRSPYAGHYLIDRELDPARKVSVIIPTVGSSALIWGVRRNLVVDAIRSLLAHTEHTNLEIVVVHDSPTPESVLEEIREVAGDRLVEILFDEPFNFSRKMNVGVLQSTGDRLVFLNDDVEFCSDRWLENLVAPLDEPDVGMTGAKLYFSSDTIQHAGHCYDKGQYLHAFLGDPRTFAGPFGALLINREVSRVTAACSAMRREVFYEIGGFTELLPLNFNDVDLCYKTRRVGYRIVWIANCEAYHFESRTRMRVVDAWEKDITVRRWGSPRNERYLPGVADLLPLSIKGFTR
ncbi:MAG: glycosyltransferase family 2 protein [Nocardioides sp.]